MKIKSLSYKQNHYGRKWGINKITIDSINLIVGKNASGKTSTIRVIRTLADLICGDTTVDKLVYSDAEYNVVFVDKNDEFSYYLKYQNGAIIKETLKKNNKTLIDRLGNTGKIYYQVLDQKLDFETGLNILAVSFPDSKQHPFLVELQNFGKNLNYFVFSTTMGKEVALSDSEKAKQYISLKNGKVVPVANIFNIGNDDKKYSKTIISDLKYIGYDITRIGIDMLHHPSLPAKVITVQEKDLSGYTDQVEMSNGMYRALSLIVQLEYSIANNLSSCILIDDIGEGLDFNRSSLLIQLLMQKAKEKDIQLIMTTNDRYVMNKIDIKYWQIVVREKSKTIFYNINNSKEMFDEFEYYGLNNFDFFASDLFKKEGK